MMGHLAQMHAGAPALSLHQRLREATNLPHNRLHGHAGFAAVQDGTIALDDYAALLTRLHGFYVPFEAEAGLGPLRQDWLAADLRALGRDPAASRLCPDIPRLETAARRLGAAYVAEGSALGGRSLYRGLDRLLGGGTRARGFFIGRAGETHAAWAAYLASLTDPSIDPSLSSGIVAAAVETFAIFEHWMAGWRSADV